MSRIEPRPTSPVPLVERPEHGPKRRRDPRDGADDDERRKDKKSPKETESDADRNEDEPGEQVDVYL